MSKYHAIRTTIDGITFDSKAEAKRYEELKLLEKAGEILAVEVHERFPLLYGVIKLGDYEADFSYYIKGVAQMVVEDVKGVKTPLYRWKKKHFEAQYGIKITEITKRSRR